ncbi:MAG TPA: malectin domain-containing carbohydrate-binding protein [Planctomycetota bacterium]|nr:malectin domain-containing carbohydrate-binding protein [Planctomycetota bacterium]
MRKALVLLAGWLALFALPACARKVQPTEAPGAQAARWGYVGGLTVKRPDAEVKNTQDKAIYLNEHYSMTAYRIAVANGTYAVKLHFAETYEKIEDVGQRVFSVAVEGKPVLGDLDVFKEAGKQRCAAVVKDLEAEVADGELTIEFAAKVQNPMINGIEVVAKRRGRARGAALLINCGATADYAAKDRRVWRKDQEYPAP